MMHKRRMVGLLIQATFLSSIFLGAKVVMTVETPTCPKEAFNCGNLGHISYPFWGGSRGMECGRQGFHLICSQGNVPLLNISSLSYVVHKLDFSSNTLTVARQDFLNTTCPKPLYNTTLDFSLFTYPPKSRDVNVTLYYNCTPRLINFPNTFYCLSNTYGRYGTTNVFRKGNASSGPGDGITCKSNIYVPVNKKYAQSEDPSIDVLRPALASGFSIQWSHDENQWEPPYYNENAYPMVRRRVCDIANRCSTGEPVVPSAAPQQHQGMQPVQTPAYASESPAYASVSPGYASESPSYHQIAGKGSSAGKSPKRIAIGVALSAVGVIILCISISCFLKRKHSSINNGQNPECKQDVKKLLFQHGSLTPKRYRYSEIKKMTKSFSDKLGQGGFGSVYKGTLPNGRLVAVKVLIETTDGNGEEFINEIASISRTSHVNIVSLLGFCHDRNKRAIVYEFMPNKSLDKFLTSTDYAHCCLELEKLYRIAVGIAKGVEYLHTGCTTRIVHFDIKPQNILLDDDFCPKISDFGLAKLCKKQQSILSVLGTRGTIGYIAPEVFSRNFGGVSHKSDVYSYGMVLLEMAGAKRDAEAEAEAEANQLSENYFPDKIYEQVMIDVSEKLDDSMIEEEEEIRRKMFLIGFWCIQTIPSHRPSISKVAEMLEGSLQSIQIPPKPFLFSPNLPKHEISSTLSANVEIEEYSAQD